MTVLTTAPRALPEPQPCAAPGRAVRAVASAMLGGEIAIHAYLAPDHLEEMPYVGVGFVAAAVVLSVVVVGILARPGRAIAWWAGAVVCAGMAAAFVLSRTAGLPDFHESWTSDGDLGLVSLAGELGYLACARVAVAQTFVSSSMLWPFGSSK